MTFKGKIGENTMVARAAGLLATDMDGQWVMMSVENGRYYNLNPVGSRIWDLIEKPLAVGDLVRALLAEYKVEEEQCRTSVSAFLAEMIQKGLVTVA
jgi:hypothetical protein